MHGNLLDHCESHNKNMVLQLGQFINFLQLKTAVTLKKLFMNFIDIGQACGHACETLHVDVFNRIS